MPLVVRALEERDLPVADRVCRIAFGTFVGAPDPETFFGDAEYVRPRWRADPAGAFVAELDGEVVGSNFATTWGSFGFFGPLSVRPDLWDRGIARRLLEPVMELFTTRGISHAALFTFAQSAKHVGLYQRFGFWPRFLTFVMTREVAPRSAATAARYSALRTAARAAALTGCRALTEAILPGLEVRPEIQAVAAQDLGDTILLRDDAGVAAFAVCHCGPATEAGGGTCYVKFGAARPGEGAGDRLEQLLDAVETYAAAEGAVRLVAGVSAAREDACRRLVARGFRTTLQGIGMQRPNAPGHARADVHVLDDWR
jgi:GNAT superfamily N-acetyltransferase